jgi:hypothetical protein
MTYSAVDFNRTVFGGRDMSVAGRGRRRHDLAVVTSHKPGRQCLVLVGLGPGRRGCSANVVCATPQWA